MLGTAVDINDVKNMYDISALPAAAVGRDGAFIYNNDAFSALCGEGARPPRIAHTGKAYDKYIELGGREYRIFVTPYEDMSVAVFFDCGGTGGTAPALSAAVRHAVSSITHSADELNDILRAAADGQTADNGADAVTELLNSVDRTAMTLLSEFVIPEQIRLLRHSRAEEYDVVSVSESAERLADALSAVLAKQPLGIVTNIAAGMFARMDIKALKLLVTSYVTDCLENGEYDIDGIGITLVRRGEDRMLLTLSCSIIAKRGRRLESSAVVKPAGYAPADELAAAMKEIFGCSIDVSDDMNCRQIRVEMKCAEGPRSDEFRSPIRVYGTLSRYADENVMLSRFGMNPRY